MDTPNEGDSATLPTGKEAPIESPAEFVPETVGPKPDDIETRVKNFNADLELIQKKHELTLSAEAKIVNGMVFAEPKVLDTRLILKQKAEEEKRRAEAEGK